MTVQSAAYQMIVGLGNPGKQYKNTRHNVGCWVLEQLLSFYGGSSLNWSKKNNLNGFTAKIFLNNQPVHLLLPTTFMNHSGLAVRAAIDYYDIPLQSVLVVHDELDFAAGLVRFKQNGGAGGHNGLRSIMQHCGASGDFGRLRIGIGRPQHRNFPITDYVLGLPTVEETNKIHSLIDYLIPKIKDLLLPERSRVIEDLHRFGDCS